MGAIFLAIFLGLLGALASGTRLLTFLVALTGQRRPAILATLGLVTLDTLMLLGVEAARVVLTLEIVLNGNTSFVADATADRAVGSSVS